MAAADHAPASLTLRPAGPDDAPAMAAVQNAIHAAGLRRHPATEAQVLERYVTDPGRIACTLALQTGRVRGFQSLQRAGEGNPYHLPAHESWGIIGTHIDPQAGRSGLGRALMAVSLDAARAAGLAHLDAAIGADNAAALGYYRAMGFRPYDRPTEAGVIPHRLDL